ncbi:hypothetical protein DAPPUDRAFT_328941 [Daphnia pulex]|uniref:Uncharacterized protein n=1 Tax=Daphnia pulex TaxID=6669 RepID=E9HF67_DAPPU|nr:hypothetical protein DAPPUDRAFT_328941 [Daphnia pulex]|eukprot:EFX69639.1 hypothetical protein DAPPUDRAFT_328941 [Daphnia pulex]
MRKNSHFLQNLGIPSSIHLLKKGKVFLCLEPPPLLTGNFRSSNLATTFRDIGYFFHTYTKLAAKSLQETHSERHLANLIRKSGSIEVNGIVLAVLDHSVDVDLIYLEIIRRLYIEVNCIFTGKKVSVFVKSAFGFMFTIRNYTIEDDTREVAYKGIGKLTLVWDPESPGSQPTHQVISVFSLLEILLVPHTENDKLDFTLVLQRPNYVQ